MEPTRPKTITVETKVDRPIAEVWTYWTDPSHIVKWNFANDDWCCPNAKNELNAGGEFSWRMEAKDGSMGFDFNGKYSKVDPLKVIAGQIEDGRSMQVQFEDLGDKTLVTEIFEIEDTNTAEQQRGGWQSILENFKRYAEGHSNNL
ncbi:SRPBCC domain-containing protein [Neolewinella persica]|uniref:SRPBCC domain-containing protein n=1 Tax=Neolewinella persica TaxID=70998 RepID=UPI0003647EB4|nr:SRPBCC domain-containing protein [Neolewinella persica]